MGTAVATKAIRVPPEIVDQIIDYFHSDPMTLKACSLVAREWIPSARLHLFAKLSFSSARDEIRFKELVSSSPNLLHHCQELTAGVTDNFGLSSGSTPHFTRCLPMLRKHVDRFSSLRTLRVRGSPSRPKNFFKFLVEISDKITTITFTGGNLRSRHDLWTVLRLFPNLRNVHVSDLGYSDKEGLAIPLGHCHSPPISSFSLNTYCLGFVLEQLSDPPYPLAQLQSLEIHHTDQRQRHLNSVAAKYRCTITALKFGAHSKLGSDIPPHIGMYERLRTLILGKLELFAAYSSSHAPTPTVPSFAWVTATIPHIKSRLNRLVFEIAVTKEHDLNAISWEDVDAFLDAREQFGDLESVEVVFLDTFPMSIPWHSGTPCPGIDLSADMTKRMQKTVKRGLLKCSARGLRTLW